MHVEEQGRTAEQPNHPCRQATWNSADKRKIQQPGFAGVASQHQPAHPRGPRLHPQWGKLAANHNGEKAGTVSKVVVVLAEKLLEPDTWPGESKKATHVLGPQQANRTKDMHHHHDLPDVVLQVA